MTEIRYRVPALVDLAQIQAYIHEDNPNAAQAVIARIKAALDRLTLFPLSGRKGEVAGTYSDAGQSEIFQINAITRRRDPIHYAIHCGFPETDTHGTMCLGLEAATKAHLEKFTKDGKLAESSPLLVDGEVQVFADETNKQALKETSTLDDLVAAHITRLQSGDYFAMNVYEERTDAVHAIFDRIRTKIRETKQVATTVGYGPRFLHSTGQLHKGGPNSGVFIQVTCDDAEDLAIPDEPYSFGVLKAAQALGDLQSLTAKGRRVIRIHVGSDVIKGLTRLEQAIESALCAHTH